MKIQSSDQAKAIVPQQPVPVPISTQGSDLSKNKTIQVFVESNIEFTIEIPHP